MYACMTEYIGKEKMENDQIQNEYQNVMKQQKKNELKETLLDCFINANTGRY